MASGQRAFAQKLNRKGAAAEVRKQISTAHTPELTKSISGANLSAGLNIPLQDVVDPPDFEEFLYQHQNAIDRDPIRSLLEFPDDDVTVERLRRRVRTLAPIIPEHGSEADPHVRDCIKTYTSDYTIVNRCYEEYVYQHLQPLADGNVRPTIKQEYEVDLLDETLTDDKDSSFGSKRCSANLSETSRGSWASSIFDLKNSQGDQVNTGLLEHVPNDELDNSNNSLRQHSRQYNLMQLFPPMSPDDIIEKRQPAVPPSERKEHRIMVKCLKLKLDLEVEPIFASMALYDVKEKKKISENYYFDMTAENMKEMLRGHIPYQDVSTLSRSCIFSLTYPSSDVFLVLKLEKVLQQGDISEVAEPYIKIDDRNREKVRHNAQYYCERLGKYRMPFAWTAVHLVNVVNGGNERESDKPEGRSESLDRKTSLVNPMESFRGLRRNDSSGFMRHGSLERQKRSSWTPEDVANYDNFRPVTLTVSSFFKQESDKLGDEDLFKFLGDLKRGQNVNLRKLKNIQGMLKLDVSPCTEEVQYCLTPELYKVDPFPDDKHRPTKEVSEFPPHEVYEPNTTYRNMMFVYPRSLNFANRQGSARNIAVKVQFMNGEEEQNALPVIFGKSSCPEFTKEAYTTVTYHNRNPDFYEEVKVKLPAKLTDSHHLLFTFYHVSCQKKVEMQPLESAVGYTWLPLLRDGHLTTGEFTLPVSIEKPPPSYHMLHPEVQLPGMKWVDNHKGIFSVDVKAQSSLHTLDNNLDRFLTLCNAAEEERIPQRIGEANFENELKNAVLSLPHAQPGPLVHFLTLILNKLLSILVKPPVIGGQVVTIAQSIFESLAHIVRRIQNIPETKSDFHARNELLTTFIAYSCNLPHPENVPMSNMPLQRSMSSAPTNAASSYSTLGRPASLPLGSQTYHRSNSDPDLTNSNPGSPDLEVGGIFGGRGGMDRSGSLRYQEVSPYLPRAQGRKIVHEEIALQWVVSSGSAREQALANAWFFFELMVKSMGEHLAKTDKLILPRKARFSEQYLDDVASLVQMITRDIIERYNKDFSFITSLNSSLAFFLRDCFTYMDRGAVFKHIKYYCKSIAAKISTLADASSLVSLKIDFMRIVCSHEHYMTLNLPFGTPLTPSPSTSPTPSIESTTSQASNASTSTLTDKGLFTELSNEYRMQHFLAGLVLSDLATVLETNNSRLHMKAINLVCGLISSHDADARYQDPDVRARVANLYLPLLGIIMEAIPQLFDPYADVRQQRLSANLSEMEGEVHTTITQHVAMAIAGSAVYSATSGSPTVSSKESPSGQATENKSRKSQLNPDATRSLLISFLWVIKNADQRVIYTWWSEMAMSKLNQLLEVLYFVLSNFEYKGLKAMRNYSLQTIKKSVDMKSKLEEAILGSTSARSDMMMRRRGTTSNLQYGIAEKNPPSPQTDSARLRWRKDQTHWKQNADSIDGLPRRGDLETDAQIEGNLASEVTMIVLDTLEIIIQIVQSTDTLQSVLAYVLRVLLHALGLNQSSMVLQNLFASQRALVAKFPELVFEEETEQCADLCLRLLRHCSSAISSTRANASASLYLLMRHNFEIGNNFARVKMQVTMSLSSLVGQNHSFNEEYLRKSLKTILTYADVDQELQDTTFPEQVRDLVFNLHMILSDTVKMKEFQNDPEMLIDLMYRIAKGYQNSPDLRLTWLQNMAAKHAERNNHQESAHCLVHAAGLVAEYLNMIEDRTWLPVGCVSLQHVTCNVLEESAVSDDVVSPDEEGICSGKYFTESGLVGLLEQTASAFNMAGLYECVNDVYKVLIPIQEYNREYKKLAQIHSKIQDAFNNIVRQEGKRLFGTYFRVGFYGKLFEELDGEEFIYKEPNITKLPEISHRLENFYSERFGESNLEIIKDSNAVDKSRLNPEKAYIQITYVEPYFDLYELSDRVTDFEKHYNIRRFMFATPFTMDGRAHGDLRDQYKKKTLLTTTHSFPYIKTRLSVIHREQLILTPIEVAIEDMQKKIKELAMTLRQEPPDTKMLQMVLQGCIGTTVNQGPVEIAIVFLGEIMEGKTPPSHHHVKLRMCFKDFLKKCNDALQKNKTLIGLDQREYQRELERNYLSVREKLMPLLSTRVTSPRKSRHKKERNPEGSRRTKPGQQSSMT